MDLVIKEDNSGSEFKGKFYISSFSPFRTLSKDGNVYDSTMGRIRDFYWDTKEEAQAALDKYLGKSPAEKLYVVMKDGRPVLYSHTPLEIVEVNHVCN